MIVLLQLEIEIPAAVVSWKPLRPWVWVLPEAGAACAAPSPSLFSGPSYLDCPVKAGSAPEGLGGRRASALTGISQRRHWGVIWWPYGPT